MDVYEARSDIIWIKLEEGPLDTAAIAAFLPAPEVGGIDLFVGTTRRLTGVRETVTLAYECFPSMAIKEMERIAREAMDRWGVVRVAMHHRLGEVPACEASVVLGAGSPHRREAFEACRFLIDTLKADVPIWKKEHFADGSSEWVQRGG